MREILIVTANPNGEIRSTTLPGISRDGSNIILKVYDFLFKDQPSKLTF